MPLTPETRRKGGTTERVMFLRADNDGYKLGARHDAPIDADDLPGLVAAFQDRTELTQHWAQREKGQECIDQWWFATAEEIKANDYNLSAGRYRPLSQVQAEHRDPRELLDELAAIETEIMSEIESLREQLGFNGRDPAR